MTEQQKATELTFAEAVQLVNAAMQTLRDAGFTPNRVLLSIPLARAFGSFLYRDQTDAQLYLADGLRTRVTVTSTNPTACFAQAYAE